MNNTSTDRLEYFLFVLLLVFTTFEFFFRNTSLSLGFMVCVGLLGLFKGKLQSNYKSSVFIIMLLVVTLLQVLVIPRYKITALVSCFILLFGSLSLANFLKGKFIRIWINVIYIISIYSLVIYISCQVPAVKEYLVNRICPMFPSMNVEDARIEGGGLNFIIYNIQMDYVDAAIGFMRNCGPFWEPGMYAVFLNIALFFHLFIEKSPLKYVTPVLILSLITTVSTGGYYAGLFIIVLYFLKIGSKNHFLIIVGAAVALYGLSFLSELEFMGDKLNTQLSSNRTGSDLSRFDAIATQWNMIKYSFVLGGESIEDYSETGTLSSGVLLPFVNYGVFVGLFFYVYILKSFRYLTYSYQENKTTATYFFLLILILLISQTFITKQFFYVMIIVGLLSATNINNNTYK